MRIPYDRSLLERKSTVTGFSEKTEKEIADHACNNFLSMSLGHINDRDGFEFLTELADTYVAYLLKNSPGNLPESIRTEKDVLEKEQLFKTAAGPQVGGEIIKELYEEIDAALDKALGINGPKRS